MRSSPLNDKKSALKKCQESYNEVYSAEKTFLIFFGFLIKSLKIIKLMRKRVIHNENSSHRKKG